jgi:hypothetical protein
LGGHSQGAFQISVFGITIGLNRYPQEDSTLKKNYKD